MLSRVAGAVPPPRDPHIPEVGGGALHLVYFHLSFPEKFFSVPTLLSSCYLHTTQGFALWRPHGLGGGKKRALGPRRELGGMGGQLGRGACAAKHQLKPG